MTLTKSVSALADLTFAQNVKLSAGDTFSFMRNVEFGWTRPETRYAHGLTRTYGHGPPDAELTFTLSANAGAYAWVMDASAGASGDEYGEPDRGVLKDTEWKITFTGNSGDTEILTAKGKLRDITVRKPDGDNSEIVDIDCVVRITDNTVKVELG